MEYPGYRGFECGLPDCYYYFIPGSGRGSNHEHPHDPLNRSFTNCADGIGINLGCPLRLYEALLALDRLPNAAQVEARHGLASANKHLPTVEELLWVTVWNHRSMISRPQVTGKNHDWLLEFNALKVRMECKFAPFTWALTVDGHRFGIHPSFSAGKAQKQLPNPPEVSSINLLAVTGIAPPDQMLRRSFAVALNEQQHIEAIAYRGLNNQLTIFAHSEEIAGAIGSQIRHQAPDEFQVGYPVIWDREQAARREEAWKKCFEGQLTATPLSTVFEFEVPATKPKRTYSMPPLPYRFYLEQHLPTGEPVFKFINPYLD